MTPLSSTVREAAEQILKQDRLGRVRVPAARRRELLAEYERSGMSGAEFAAYVGVKYPTFATWLAKARKLPESPPAAAQEGPTGGGQEIQPARWVEASVEGLEPPRAKGGCHSGALMVQLPGGARLEIGDSGQAALAAELLRALEQSSGRPGRC